MWPRWLHVQVYSPEQFSKVLLYWNRTVTATVQLYSPEQLRKVLLYWNRTVTGLLPRAVQEGFTILNRTVTRYRFTPQSSWAKFYYTGIELLQVQVLLYWTRTATCTCIPQRCSLVFTCILFYRPSFSFGFLFSNKNNRGLDSVLVWICWKFGQPEQYWVCWVMIWRISVQPYLGLNNWHAQLFLFDLSLNTWHVSLCPFTQIKRLYWF